MVDMAELTTWIGKSETSVEQIAPFPASALAATLARDGPPFISGSALPPLWHWLHFLPIALLSETGADGHPRRGGFLPPVALPRRMWAGSRLVFTRPLHIGETARKTSTIAKVEHKSGRSGELVFVTVRHVYEGEAGPALTDEHDIVYRQAAPTGVAPAVPPRADDDAAWRRTIVPSSVLLFRYSALTFNSHRIHYDYPYVTQDEGYPDLVVHGPLIATLLLDLLHRKMPDVVVAAFSFRAISPLFADAAFEVRGKAVGRDVMLWASNAEGGLAMEGKATLA